MAGLPILALPGLTSDEGLWQPQAAALGAAHPFTSFALERPDAVTDALRELLAGTA